MRRHIGRLLVLGFVGALAVGAGAAQADAAKVVTVRGGVEFEPNQFIADTLRFTPGRVVVRPGQRVRWEERARERSPHTMTVVRKRDLPTTIDEIENCQACALALGHLSDPSDPQNSGLKTLRLNRGKPGFDRKGDSLFLRPRSEIGTRVTAEAGRTLYYVCAIHPWMQGKIVVRAAAAPPPPTGKR